MNLYEIGFDVFVYISAESEEEAMAILDKRLGKLKSDLKLMSVVEVKD